ncbi:tripartite tricarboxylate transporter TctB family protein, partial [Frigidibacter sp. MR17.24]|uniref:tripartite tricarboxylate transporter TctB family protein n=1 Tax=Frigidibacter sp. MR17.24 TaxID=3127345 RepID=UPI003012DE97
PRRAVAAAAGFWTLTLVLGVALNTLGFLVAGFVLAAGWLLVLSRPASPTAAATDLGLGFVAAAAIQLIFARLLMVPLP